MCEFTIFKRRQIVFKGTFYTNFDGSKVTVRDILGISKTFENCTIEEVSVQSERLILQAVKE